MSVQSRLISGVMRGTRLVRLAVVPWAWGWSVSVIRGPIRRLLVLAGKDSSRSKSGKYGSHIFFVLFFLLCSSNYDSFYIRFFNELLPRC